MSKDKKEKEVTVVIEEEIVKVVYIENKDGTITVKEIKTR